MSTALPVPEGSAEAGDITAWLDAISFCNHFCDWVDNECDIDSLTADSDTQQQPVESTAPKDSVQKSPTGASLINK